MDARVSDPYLARKINLGSGPRERASSCSCTYRTSHRRQSGSSYISLRADPIVLSYEKQRYRRSYDCGTAPLIRALNREPIYWFNGKIHKRAASAKLRCQSCNSETTKPKVGSFMQVKGKTIACKQRPHLEKRVTDDHIIKSVQDATAEHLTLDMFDVNAYSNLIAPCPSPEQSEENSEAEQVEFTCMPQSEMSMERVCCSPSSSLEIETVMDRMKNLSGCNVGKSMKDIYKARAEYLEKDTDVEQALNKGDDCKTTDVLFSIPIPRVCMDFPRTPDLVVNPHSGVSQYSPVERDSTDYQRPGIPMSTKSPCEARALGEKRRCSSASPILRFNVKCKSVEFLSEKDVRGAQLHLSKGPLEILYNKLLLKKSTFPGLKSDSNKQTAVISDTVNSDGVPVKESTGADAPLEVKVASDALPKKHLTAAASIPNGTSKVRSLATIQNEKSTEIVPSKRTITRKVDKPAIKLLHRADKDLCERKAMKENDPGMIWRNISGIDLQNNEPEGSRASQRQLDPSNCQIGIPSPPRVYSQDLGSNGVKNEKAEEVNDTEKCNGNASGVKSCIKDSSSVGKSDESAQQRDGYKCERKIRFAESDDSRVITRPTSAVIRRYMEMMRQNREGSAYKNTSSKLMKRPASGNTVSVNKGKRVGGRVRCSSATGFKSSSQYSKSAKSTVVSAQSLDMKPANKQIQLTNRQDDSCGVIKENSPDKSRKEPVASTLSPRPKSAPAKASNLDVIEEEQNISEECSKVMDACRKKGINVSMDTLKRALMPPSEFAKPYSKENMPHPSRLLTGAFQWSDRHTRTNK